jgi:molybdopterin synthase sulfur carrier subunit
LEENRGGIAADFVCQSCGRADRWSLDSTNDYAAVQAGEKEEVGDKKRKAKEVTLMQISFHIPGALREFTEKKGTVQVEVEAGVSLLEALQALFATYPGLRDRVLTETGETRRHVNIFVANENVRYTGGLATTVVPGMEVSIVPAISGG